MMGRQGRALTGIELAEGLAGLATREVDELAGQSCLGQAKGQWWCGMHLTFPRAKVEWVPCEEGIWIRLLLGMGKEWEFRWQDRQCDIREMREIGPFASPDDFREALGLARIAQFKLPGGDVVTAELPESVLRARDVSPATVKAPEGFEKLVSVGGPNGEPPSELELYFKPTEVQKVTEEVDRQMEKMVERVEREVAEFEQKEIEISEITGWPKGSPEDWAYGAAQSNFNVESSVQELPQQELLAEPPTVEPIPPAVAKAKPVGAALKGKGGKKR